MGIHDRDYSHNGYQGSGRPQMRLMMPSMSPVVKWLLMINVAVFVIEVIFFGRHQNPPNPLEKLFAVWPENLPLAIQFWRVVSYQFLHDVGDISHLFGNMLGLFFFGRLLEGTWGSRKFLTFYLICGAAGGVLYTILARIGLLNSGFLIGASGAVLGIIAAGAILFPRSKVYVLGIFPLPLYVLAIILLVFSLFGIFVGKNLGGEVAHLAGMAVGAVYVLGRPWLEGRAMQQKKGAWEHRIQNERQFQAEVDRILDKVHASGVNSLTRKEKSILREATQREQQERR